MHVSRLWNVPELDTVLVSLVGREGCQRALPFKENVPTVRRRDRSVDVSVTSGHAADDSVGVVSNGHSLVGASGEEIRVAGEARAGRRRGSNADRNRPAGD
jgi:hypothetical protein